MVTATKRMTLDEFLAMPETEPPSEFLCGEVVQKPMPSYFHGRIAAEICRLILNYFADAALGWVVVDGRHAQRSERRAYLPDVSVVLAEHLPDQETLARGPVEIVPDIAIEILSPDDLPSRIAEKLAFYMRNNTPLVWVIDPDDRTLDAHRPGAPSTHHTVGDTIDAAPVLPDFRLDVGALFGVLGPAQ